MRVNFINRNGWWHLGYYDLDVAPELNSVVSFEEHPGVIWLVSITQQYPTSNDYTCYLDATPNVKILNVQSSKIWS